MISVPFAHVGGIPIEEALGSFGPALLVGFGVAWVKLRARLRPLRSRAGPERGARRGRAGLKRNSDDQSAALPQARHTIPSAPFRREWAE